SSQGLVLQNNGTDDLKVMPNGSAATAFIFPQHLARGSNFLVSVRYQPQGQMCIPSGESGTIGAADVASVVVDCASGTFTIGGLVSGVEGPFTVSLNDGMPLKLSANGNFAFPVAVSSGEMYDVKIVTQPQGQTCTLMKGTGSVGMADVRDIQISCI